MTGYYEPAPGWDQPPAGRCRPGMLTLRAWVLDRWPGTTHLGCYGDRAVTGGRSPSVHRDGRATDVGTPDAVTANRIVLALVDQADPLGLQMVLDYRNHRRWRLPYNAADLRGGFGPWVTTGGHLHIERTNAGADDPRPIPDVIEAPQRPPPSPPQELDVREQIARGVKGPLVVYTQASLKAGGWPATVVDGIFGEQTEQLVRQVQTANKLPATGVVDLSTWMVIDVYANRATA